MNGETDLAILLKTMKPTLHSGEYVFCTLLSEADLPKNIIASFREQEGLTVIIEKSGADQLGLTYSFIASWITLTVHSSLEAVGLTAAFSQALAAENISCNVVAAYYHDHIFVKSHDAQKAMAVLIQLSA